MKVTRFPSLRNSKKASPAILDDIIADIASDMHKIKVEKYRDTGIIKLKDSLPVFTPAGEFEKRSKAGLIKINGLVTLDIDHVDDAISLKEIAENITWVRAAFITPSGKGIKVIVETDIKDPADWVKVELEVSTEWEKITGFPRDNRAKDIARIHFICWDPTVYYNKESEIFKTKIYG